MTEIGLSEIPESGRIVLPISRLTVGDQLGGLGLALLELAAEVKVLGVLADDHEIDTVAGEEAADARVFLAGPDARVEVERLAEVDVDAPEAGADGRRDRCLERDLACGGRLSMTLSGTGVPSFAITSTPAS